MKDPGVPSSNRLSQLARAMRTGLFGALFVMSKRITSPSWQVIVAMFITAWQLLSFVYTTPSLAEDYKLSVAPLKYLSSITNPTRFLSWLSPSTHAVLFFLAVTWVLAFLLLTAHAMYQFVTNSFTLLFTLKVLRVMGQLSTSVLFMPLVSMLMSTFECGLMDSRWSLAGYACDSAGFYILQALSATLSVALFFLCSMFALVFFDSNPLSKQLVAKAHGRVDFIFLTVQVVLALTCNVFAGYLNAWILIAVIITSAATWLVAMLVCMPFYRHGMNTANIMVAVTFFYASICLIFNKAYKETDAAVMSYVGLPLALLSGVALSNMRAAHIVKLPAARVSNVYELELKTRYLLHQALWGHYTDRIAFGYHANTMTNQAKTARATSIGSSRRQAEALADTSPVIEEAIAIEESDPMDDDDDRSASIRKLLPTEVVDEVQTLFRVTTARFRQSSMLHIFFARFYAAYQGNRHMQMSHLLQAERRSPPLDVAFLVFQARKLAETDSGKSGQMSAINRVSFEKYAADARKFVIKAAARQVSFWLELCDQYAPDLSRLHRLSSEMNDAIASAERSFTELFSINPQSLVIMRLYAAFNLHVTCNLDKANVLLAEADRIEDQKSKDHRSETAGRSLPIMEESSLDVFADNTGVITIGGGHRNLALILSVNSSCCKIFGYSRLQLERRNVFSLLPYPLDSVHEIALKQYVATGEGRIVDYTRVVFGLHKLGYIIPLLLSVRESPPDDGPPTFIVLFRELRCEDNHVLMLEDFTIVGASAASLSAMDIESSSLQSRDITIKDFIGEWDSIQQQLQTSQNCTFAFQSMHMSSTQYEHDDASPMVHRDTVGVVYSDDEDYGTRQEDIPKQAETVWARGHLQKVGTMNGGSGGAWVLHWQRIPESDRVGIRKAENRRGSSTHLGPNEDVSAGFQTATAKRTVSLQPKVAGIPLTLKKPRSSVDHPNASLRDPGSLSSADEGSPHAAMSFHHPNIVEASGDIDTYVTGADPVRELVQTAAPKYASAMRNLPGPIAMSPKSPVRVWEEKESAPLENIERVPSVHTNMQKNTKSSVRGDDPKDDGRSAGSSASSASKSLTRLRRLFADHNPPLLTGLKYLRVVGIAITILAIGLATVSAFTTVSSFRRYLDNVEYTTLGAQRMVLSFNAIIPMQDLVAAARRWRPIGGTGMGINGSLAEESIRRYMLDNMTEFTAVHRKMYTHVQGTPAMSSYTKRKVTALRYDLPTSGANGDVEVYNLFEGGVALATALSQVAITPLANISELTDPNVRFTTTNGLPGGNIHEDLHATMEAGYSLSVDTEEQLYQQQIIIFASMVGLLLIISLGIFLPILLSIEKAKDAIVVRFVELPPLVKTLLYEQALKRYRTLRQHYMADDDDDDDDDNDKDDDENNDQGDQEGALPSMSDFDEARKEEDANKAAFAVPVGQTGGEEEIDWSKVLSAGAKSRASSKRIAARSSAAAQRLPKVRKSARSFIMLVLKFIGPLLALMIFFSVIFAASIIYIQNALTLSSIAASATARASCSREVVMDLTSMMIAVADRDFMRQQNVLMDGCLNCIDYYTKLLAFGADTSSFLSRFAANTPVVENGNSELLPSDMNEQVYSAMFSDACPYLLSVSPHIGTLERCRSFGGGIFAQGLLSGLSEYRRRARRLQDRRMRARIFYGAGEPRGILLPADTYDRSQDLCPECEEAAAFGDHGATDLDPIPHFANASFIGDIPPPANITLDGVWLDDNGDVFYPGSAPYYIGSELQSEDMHWLREADALYVTPGMFAIATNYSNLCKDVINTFISFATIFVAVFLVTFVLFMLLLFLPQIRRTNLDIQTKRTMLLYLPPEVVAHNKTIKSLVQSILASETEALARGTLPRNSSAAGSASARMTDSGGSTVARAFHEGGSGNRALSIDV